MATSLEVCIGGGFDLFREGVAFRESPDRRLFG